VRTVVHNHRIAGEPVAMPDIEPVAVEAPVSVAPLAIPSEQPPRAETPLVERPRVLAFATFWEFAVAVNRSDPAALALAGNGAASDIPIDGVELKRLLGMMWFRTVLTRLSRDWRERIFSVLIDTAIVADHPVKLGRQIVHLRELTYEQLQEIGSKTMLPDWVRPDVDLLVTVGRFWGADAVKRFRFVDAPERHEPSMVENLLQRLRG